MVGKRTPLSLSPPEMTTPGIIEVRLKIWTVSRQVERDLKPGSRVVVVSCAGWGSRLSGLGGIRR